MLGLLLTMAQPATVTAQSPAEVTLVPAATTLNVDGTTTVEIRIGPAEDVYGAELHLDYDPARIAFVDQDASREGVQPARFGGSLLQPDFVAQNAAAAGRVNIAVTQLAPAPAVSGPGLLATLEIVALSPGSTTISFVETEGQAGVVISTPDGDALPSQGVPMTIEIAGAGGGSTLQASTRTPTATPPPSATPTMTRPPAGPTPVPSHTSTRPPPATSEEVSQGVATPASATPRPTATPVPATPTSPPTGTPPPTSFTAEVKTEATPVSSVNPAPETGPTPERSGPGTAKSADRSASQAERVTHTPAPPSSEEQPSRSVEPTVTERHVARAPVEPTWRADEVARPAPPRQSPTSRLWDSPLLAVAGALVLGFVAWLILKGVRGLPSVNHVQPTASSSLKSES